MESMQEHDAMDKIMNYLNDDKSGNFITARRIWSELFHSEDEEVIYVIITKMMRLDVPVFEFHIRNIALHNFDVIMKANGLTNRSIEQGGFTEAYKKRIIEQTEDARIKKLEISKLTKEEKAIGQNRILAILGIVLSALAFGYTIYSDSQNPSKPDFDAIQKKVELLEQRMKLLETKTTNKESHGFSQQEINVSVPKTK